jgi:predicted transcriptional regulator of viral defense system
MTPIRKKRRDPLTRAVNIFQKHGGMLRTNDALRLGIHPAVLYELHRKKLVQAVARGIYRLSSLRPLDHPDFVPVAMKAPKAVICLISALAFHNLTTQIPHAVSIALVKGDRPPRITHPPIRIYWFKREAHKAGVETHKADGVPFRIYSAEKTLVDCFQFRNKIGLDTAIEALKLYNERRRIKMRDIIQYARISRVQNVMRPYLETLI